MNIDHAGTAESIPAADCAAKSISLEEHEKARQAFDAWIAQVNAAAGRLLRAREGVEAHRARKAIYFAEASRLRQARRTAENRFIRLGQAVLANLNMARGTAELSPNADEAARMSQE